MSISSVSNVDLTILESKAIIKPLKVVDVNEQLETAVLFLVFNRPDVTKRVFEAIREAKPTRLYVAADGARSDKQGEVSKANKVREIATAVNWKCEVKTLFRDENLGCKRAVSSAIDWFFQHEERGIILEDDCLPHQDFFIFCENLLEKYKNDERVSVITGNNFQYGRKRGEDSYYFSKYFHCWGWAAWRRSWQMRDMNIEFWPKWKISESWKKKFPDSAERKYWGNIFEQMYEKKIDTWDYPFLASLWFKGGLTATPNVNLVSNIGFGPDSTHTTSTNSAKSNMKALELGFIQHPNDVVVNAQADRYVFDHVFGGKTKRFPLNIYYFPRRVLGFFYRKLLRSLFVHINFR
jgi:hypothetical protein